MTDQPPVDLPDGVTIDEHIAHERRTLRDLFLHVFNGLGGVTGLYGGPGAERLADEIITVLGREPGLTDRLARLGRLETLVEEHPEQPTPDTPDALVIDETQVKAQLRGVRDVAGVVTILDTFPTAQRADAARAMLRWADEEGLPHEAITALRALAQGASDPLDQGVLVAIFGEDSSLPAPGDVVELGEAHAVPAGQYVVVGFGKETQTVRVRPPTDDEAASQQFARAGTGTRSTYDDK